MREQRKETLPPYVSEDYCMCGLRMDKHTVSENHSPLSEADYYRTLETHRRKE